ncbi:MAG: ABC transporter substrate-binding protein [Syntrophaceae bacterium]|nr:ABC transporter substrate-binding protein [Syntrophaceae bacterium]
MWGKLFPLLLPCLILIFGSSSAQESKSKRIIRIGVAQSFSHPDLDEDIKGFEKALSEAGFKEGGNLIYHRQNAQNEKSLAKTITQRFIHSKLDLIHSIATLTSQALIHEIQDIPIVFSSVTDPLGAKLVPQTQPNESKSGFNVTGVSDRWPTSLQFELQAQFLSKAKKWGTLYNPGDPQSLGHIKELREVSKKYKVELVEAAILSSLETFQATKFLAGKVHAIHIAFDRTALFGFEGIVRGCNEKKIPLFVGEVSYVLRGALAAYGLDYFHIGYSAGKKAVQILGGERPGDIPWESSKKVILVVSEKAAKNQGVVIPPEYLKKANRIIRESEIN